MIKHILFCLFLGLLGQKTLAQEYLELDRIRIEKFRSALDSSQIKTLVDLDSFIHAMLESENEFPVFRRNILYGCEHQVWWTDILPAIHEEYFSLIIKENEIIAIQLDVRRNDIQNPLFIDQKKLDAVRGIKEKEYGKIELNDTLLYPLNLKIFGHWCGIGGSPPEYFRRMLKLVREKNKEELHNWLLSFDPEIQAYGAEGLYYLEKEGIPMTLKEEEILNRLFKINNQLIKCEGCFFYVRRHFREDFEEKIFKKRHKIFKKYNYLN